MALSIDCLIDSPAQLRTLGDHANDNVFVATTRNVLHVGKRKPREMIINITKRRVRGEAGERARRGETIAAFSHQRDLVSKAGSTSYPTAGAPCTLPRPSLCHHSLCHPL